jgi:hypothetical protein
MYMAEKAQTLVLLRLCTLPILPYKIERLADWTLGSLKELHSVSAGNLDLGELLDVVSIFKEKAFSLDETTERLTEKLGAGDKGLINVVDVINRCVMKVSRILNPVNYTYRGRYDQDYYGAEYVKPIPILNPVTDLISYNPDRVEYKTLKTKLIRARNKVLDSLKEALYTIEYALEKTIY